jgi:type IV secretion system protein VirD4
VLNNHRAKLFLPGIADPDTLEYASRLVGDEEVTQPSVTRDPTGRRSTTSTTTPRRLLPPEELRCLPRGQAVLVYGTLPPARLRLRPWWAGARTGPKPDPATAPATAATVTPARPASRRW